mmetsp:Transcript_33263/g.88045  ORF Transcript_33263/g.88045 Transcript_33263/m.88045 type:complete len:262 (-) Transcript_33263:511-1296(-)
MQPGRADSVWLQPEAGPGVQPHRAGLQPPGGRPDLLPPAADSVRRQRQRAHAADDQPLLAAPGAPGAQRIQGARRVLRDLQHRHRVLPAVLHPLRHRVRHRQRGRPPLLQVPAGPGRRHVRRALPQDEDPDSRRVRDRRACQVLRRRAGVHDGRAHGGAGRGRHEDIRSQLGRRRSEVLQVPLRLRAGAAAERRPEAHRGRLVVAGLGAREHGLPARRDRGGHRSHHRAVADGDDLAAASAAERHELAHVHEPVLQDHHQA